MIYRVDPEAARRARFRFGCFDHAGEDPQAYGYAASFDLTQSCEQETVEQLTDLLRRRAEYTRRDGLSAEDEYFEAEQNARLVRNAEEYYRSMFRGRMSSWNLRDRHMVETINALVGHLSRRNPQTKVVIWAHNSHLGDARATEMGRAGEWNVGQLIREDHEGDAFLIGFTTHTGTVAAATDWDASVERKSVRPSLPDSYERAFHDAGIPAFLLSLQAGTRLDRGGAADLLRPRRLERAIGVIYRPETERLSHYFHAALPDQFDAVIHFDETTAVTPLELVPGWHSAEMPEAFPSGL
jgi:erythromycin esterase-like protein